MKDLLVLAFSSTDDIKMVQYLLFWNVLFHKAENGSPNCFYSHSTHYCFRTPNVNWRNKKATQAWEARWFHPQYIFVLMSNTCLHTAEFNLTENGYDITQNQNKQLTNELTLELMCWVLSIRGSFKNRFLKSIKSHDLESILSTSYFYSFTLGGLYIIF